MNNTLSNASLDSIKFLDKSRKINIYSIALIIFVGLIGHCLTILVYSKKKFRTNSASIFLLCLAINDAIYLIIHFFEDTVRTIKGVYYENNLTADDLINILNIIDRSDLTCITISYLRYVLRFTSAYIVVAITIQRVLIVYLPLANRYKSKKFAWYCLISILIASFAVNSWVPFMFQINREFNQQICDIVRTDAKTYFKFSLGYTALIMTFPILMIFILNSMIIVKTLRSDFNREKLQKKTLITINRSQSLKLKPLILESKTSNLTTSNLQKTSSLIVSNIQHSTSRNSITSSFDRRFSKKSFASLSLSFLSKRPSRVVNQSQNYSPKMTKMLVVISISYTILNLPHLIAWSIFFTEMANKRVDNPSIKNYMFASVQISEILYVLNYGINFFLYCLCGTLFRDQLKKIFIKFFN